jgi:hypothetical protein
MRWTVLFVLVLGLTGIACASTGKEDDSANSTGTTNTADSTTAPTKSPSSPPANLVLAAIDDLANRLDVQRSAVRLIQAVDATWPDGGLGCSPPGTTFATGPIAGYLIVLNHGDRGYDYHSNRDGPAFLCPTEDKDGGYQLIPPPGFDT